jgi:hypothetical protein
MDLPNLLHKIKAPPENLPRFLAIEIGPANVKTAVWQVDGEQTEVVSLGVPRSFAGEDENEFLEAIDESLSHALADISPEPNQVIFGLPETWVSGEGIAESKKPLLKKICKALALKPVGFVVTTEAVIHYLRDTEGGPPSAVLVNVQAKELVVSLIMLGKLQGSQVVGRSNKIAADVEEGLARFPRDESLPSRIILYDGEADLEAVKQDLISHEWLRKLKFLHFPKIETLKENDSIEAVAVAGGAEVAKSLGLANETENKEGAVMEPVVEEDDFEFEPLDEPEIKAEAEEVEFEELEAEVAGGDETMAEDEEVANVIPVKDIDFTGKETDTPGGGWLNGLMALKNRLPFQGIKQRGRAKGGKKPKLILIGGLLLGLLLLGGGIYAYQAPKASVVILVQHRLLEKELTFTLQELGEGELTGDGVVRASLEEAAVSGSKAQSATGTKTVGEVAKGKVAISNFTDSIKSFPARSEIFYQDLKFTLDEAVTIASSSSSKNDQGWKIIKPGISEVTVTAAQIGERSNLSSGTELVVQNFATDSFSAEAVTAFSGGVSSEVAVVSEADRSRVYENLREELEDEGLRQLEALAGDGQEVAPMGGWKVTQESYSASANEEAENVSLTLALSRQAYIYDQRQVTALALEAAKDDVPDNYRVDLDATEIEIKETGEDRNGQVSVRAIVKLGLVPKIAEDEVASRIAGKSIDGSQEYLKSLTGFEQTEVFIQPDFFNRFKSFPYKRENITITIRPLTD